MADSWIIFKLGAVNPTDKTATKVAKVTVTISPKLKGALVLSFHTSSPINFLEYSVETKKVK